MGTRNAGGALRRFYVVFGVVCVGGIGALGYSLIRKPPETATTTPPDSVVSGGEGAAVTMPVELQDTGDFKRLTELAVPIAKGRPDAPVTILVFNDFLCPYCSLFSLSVRPRLESSLVETGQARLLIHDFPLTPANGTFLAARAARCAGDQDRYWEYHDWLYHMQITWGGSQDKLAVFQGYAERMGLDAEEFRACLNSGRHAVAVSASMAMARALGLVGAPSVLVESRGEGSRRLPSADFETIRAAVQAVLGSGERQVRPR